MCISFFYSTFAAIMIDFILDNSAFPILTAFLLGLLTMISPCPFCSDVTAISYLGKNVSHIHSLLWNSLFYVLGKCFSYTLLALVFIFGGQIAPVRSFFEHYGEPALGPFLILVGVAIALFGWHESHHNHDEAECMLPHELHHEHAPHKLITRLSAVNLKPLSGPLTSFLLGAVFAMAFCPYSGLLYFGTLIPLTMAQASSWSWLLPMMFGLGDAIPVIIIALLLSRGIAGIGRINGNLKTLEIWLRRVCIVLFLGVGLYMCVSIFGGFHHHDHGEHHHDHEHVECIHHH